MANFLRYSMRVGKSIPNLSKEFKLKGFSNIKISGSKEGNIELIMYPELDYEDKKLEESLEKITNALSISFRVKITEPFLMESKINGKHTVSNRMRCKVDIIQESTVEELAQLDEELKLELDEEKLRYYKMFKNAVNQEDTLVQYLLLYHILMIIYDDSQKKIDDFILRYYDQKIVEQEYGGIIDSQNKEEIRKLSEKEAKYLKTKKGKYNETIFSRIRNQIAHKRKDAHGNIITSEITKKQIDENIDEFKRIVVYSIKNLA